MISPAKRTEGVKEYYFSRKSGELAALNEYRKSRGLSPIISLGIGSPDRMPPEAAIEALCETAHLSDSHVYQNFRGIPQLRHAFSDWYRRWYNVDLNPDNEIQPLVGSKEGIMLLALAFVNSGDKVLVPNPGYPTYNSSMEIVGAVPVEYDLLPENDWYPDFDALEKTDIDGVKMMWMNYPSMPTGRDASLELYRRAVDFGHRHNILIVNDNPYSFVLTETPLSILEIPGAKDVCIELNSLSKAHNMSGWRIGMVAGAKEYISAVLKVKSQMDTGMFKPLQMAAVAALSSGEEWFRQLNDGYRARRDVAFRILDAIGASYSRNSAGLFVWGHLCKDNPFKLKEKETEALAAEMGLKLADPENGVAKTAGEIVSDYLLYTTGVFVVPGCIFGSNGNDCVRVSLCADVPKLLTAADAINGIKSL